MMSNPIKVFNDSVEQPLIIDLLPGQANANGMLFNVSTQEQSLTSNQSLVIVISNSSSTGVNLVADVLTNTSFQSLNVNIYRSPTFSGGSTTSLTPNTLNTAFAGTTSKATVSMITGTVTVSTGTLLLSRLIPGTTSGMLFAGGRLILSPGFSVGIQSIIKSSGTASASASWIELPV